VPEPDSTPLPHPPTSVNISWQLARELETLCLTAGLMSQADKLRDAINAAEQAAR
jgi:hypothetical protein